MGVRLVGDALRPDWCILSDRARLILLQMCYVARDKATPEQAAALYFGGHRTLIISVLGRDPERMDEVAYSTAKRAIERAIQELKKAGAITLASASSPGRTAVYEVHPNNFPHLNQDALPVDNSPARPQNGRHPAPANGRHPAPAISEEWPTNPVPNGRHPAPARGEHRGEQERHLERNHPTQPPAQLSDTRA
jgi:hypothetical protein